MPRQSAGAQAHGTADAVFNGASSGAVPTPAATSRPDMP